ncbi:MAG: tetratricopeptide repeat protein [Candidatus Acidiferrales bacterium]
MSLLKDSDRGHAYWSISWAQAHAGDFAGARLTAARIANSDWRAHALTDVAIALVEAGEPEAARAVVESIQQQPPWSRIEAMKRLANALLESGHTRSAVATLRDAVAFAVPAIQARDPSEVLLSPTGPLVSLALAQKRAGDLAGAAATVDKAREFSDQQPDAYERLWVLQNLVDMHADTGDLATALEMALQIPAGQQRDIALQSIAGAQARSGAILEARDTAALIIQLESKALTYMIIAQEQVSKGDFLGGEESLERIADPKLRAKWIVWTALSFLPVNQASAALLWLDRAGGLVNTNQLEMDPEFYGWMATVQANAGDLSSALDTARAIMDQRVRADAISHVAYSQAASGDWRGALAWAGIEGDPRDRAEALLGIARALIDRSEADGSRTR